MNKGASYFLWPLGQASMKNIPMAAGSIERILCAMFPNAHPVIVSSGRAGVTLILKGMNLSRLDLVQLFPYASHCVLEAVARIATPTAKYHAKGTRIIYHQWGYVQDQKLSPNGIEDSVDTLCRPGADLLVLGGRFEIWSLPKIIGSLGGGVIWCRDASDANKLRVLRDTSEGAPIRQWLFRWAGGTIPSVHSYWAGVEANCARLPPIAIGNISAQILRWQSIVSDRENKLELLESFIPSWLHIYPNRLPCVIFLEAYNQKILKKLMALRLNIGIRHFERLHKDGKQELIPVLPIPIHQDVPMAAIKDVKNILDDHTQ